MLHHVILERHKDKFIFRIFREGLNVGNYFFLFLAHIYTDMEAKEKVYQAMQKSGKALKTGEVAEIAGIDKKDAEKAIKQLNSI